MERNSYLIMIKFYKQIISKQTAQDIYHDFMGKIIKEHEEYVENEVPATSIDGETRGLGVLNLPSTLTEIDKIKSIVEKDFGSHYEFTHSYMRLYPNNSVLHPHIDRKGLDLTLSVNIYSSENTYWPLIISNLEMKPDEENEKFAVGDEKESYKLLERFLKIYSEYNFDIGDGACCTREHPHWRPFYEMSFEGDHYMQCFYHWKLK